MDVSADVAAGLAGDLYHLYLAAYSDQLSTLVEQRVDVEFGAAMTVPTEEAQPTEQAEATPTAAPDGRRRG